MRPFPLDKYLSSVLHLVPTPHDDSPLPRIAQWSGFALSLLAHAALVSTMVIVARRHGIEPGPLEAAPTVQLTELAPLPDRSVPQPVEQRRPPPDVAEEEPERPVPRPQVERGRPIPEDVTIHQEKPPEEGALGEAPPAVAPEPREPAAVSTPFPSREVASAAPTMESEAARLFGPRRIGAQASGPVQNMRWAQEVTDDRENDCIPRARRVLETPEMGSVSGRVYKEGSSEPLPGALLQILGTAYSAFADDQGWYTLRFDRSLVDECRTQYVQVSKDGFRPRRLILALGARSANNVAMSRR